MNIGIVSARYAKALLKFSLEQGDEDLVYRDMRCVLGAYLAYPQLATALTNPSLTLEQCEQLLLAASGKEACGSTQRFVAFVVQRHRQRLMQFIAASFIEKYRAHKHIIEATLTIPIDHLPASLMERIEHWVESQTQQHVDFSVRRDASIGGGFILEYDTYRLDASLRNQLRQIKKALQA